MYSSRIHGTTINMKQIKRFLSLALALVLVLSCVNLSIFAKAAAADYISTSYASNLSVKTNKAMALKSEPNDAGGAKYTLPANTMLTVKALHKNTSGTYYYEVLFYNMTLYVKAVDCTLVDHLTGDVSMTGAVGPASLAIGDSFGIEGVITSKKNIIGKVTAGMYKNQHISQVPVVSASATVNAYSYNLDGSTVDSSLAFGNAPAGVYEYMVIAEAVSYYINASGALVTSTQDVIVERQQCVVTDWRNPNKATAHGIDISTWQGAINWSSLSGDPDVDFAILRIGYSTTLDNRFLEYAKGCETYGIPYGVYHYSYALTAAQAKAEAQWVLNTLETYGYEPDMYVWFDMEDGTQASLATSTKEAICTAFCDTIWEGGQEPGFYGFTRWFSTSYINSYLNSMPVWIAQIDGFSSNGTATHDGGTWLWQYSWEGSYYGISGDVDSNYCYANFPGLSSSTDTPSDTTYLANCTEYPAHFSGKTTSSLTMRQYPSTSYSSLGTLSSGSTIEVTGLYKNSSGGYWYQVNYNGTNGYVDASYVTPVTYLYDDLAVINPAMASNLSTGASYKITGNMISRYNNIYSANAKVYSGEDTQVAAVLSGSHACNSKTYKLAGSQVDSALAFGSLSAGYYTYEISADVRNYYISGGSLQYKTENVVVWTAPFTVGSASITPPANLVCNHTIVTDAGVAAGCTTTGLTAGTHCSKCGVVLTEQEIIPATGHRYTYTVTNATCNAYAKYTFTCTGCNSRATYSADQMTGQWLELNVVNPDTGIFNVQTQYRYSDYTAPVEGGWNQTGSGSVKYVPSWPSGFSTSNSLYTTYNKAGSKVTASETASTKVVIESDSRCGYLYYHWCYANSYYSVANSSGSYTTFHAYYDTTDPSNYTCDTSDMSYKTSHSSCSNSNWWFVTEVYQQSYTKYTKAASTAGGWGEFSAWSTTPVTASSTRKVETRNVIQLKSATLGTHNFVNGKCTVCGTADPDHVALSPDYYLFGYINGANCGCEEDYGNLGSYKFVNGKLTTTFTTDSYIAVKNGNNLNWYMTDGWLGTTTTTATLYDSGSLSNADKLYVPGGREITFTLKVNTNGTLTLSYVAAAAPVESPTMSPKYPTLSFEDEVYLNVYFTADNLGGLTVDDMGLLTWSTARTEGTVADAEADIPGAVYVASKGMYQVRTEGIPAKCLGDTVYFKVYIRLSNGSYLYSKLLSYSPKTYANNILNTSTNTKEKALVVAMLNYGAAAQTFFTYKPYNLMNSTLTTAQKSLVKSYSSSMVASVGSVNSSKVGIFTNSGGFSRKYPTVSFEGAFSINYYFTPSATVSSTPRMYYWTAADYAKASTLTPSNASGCIIMTGSNGVYHAAVEEIAAKDLDGTIYVAAGYNSNGKNYCTGVLPYSIGSYCVSQASTAGDMQPFAQATAVYGYYAKAYFNS